MPNPHLSNGDFHDRPSLLNGEVNRRPGRSSYGDGVMPIAVVGMACRFPGGSSNPEKLWKMLANKRSGWSEVPSERFTQSSFQHPSSSVGGTFKAQGGHFLDEDVSLFDAPAFGISPLEAKSMDPQMRLQLEVAYEALENGGITLEKIAGSNTGVYIGVFSDDYSNMILSDTESLPSHHVTGTGKAIFANRISYFFDLKGPSFSLDTGCSASLVALHQACQSIRIGESKQAIVGGTNLILGPKTTMALGGLGFLSDHGRCYSFDSRASGYGRGEGVATIVIKSLEAAIADGDPIQAVIRNTAINQDGRTPGITMPSRDAQINLMRDAYKQAQLDPLETSYVEAHGTGTEAGDPIEVEAIATALSSSRNPSTPLFVGSIKANIGHLESASGLAGLIKAILCLQKGMIAPSINFETENPNLHLEEKCMKVARELQPWPVGGLRRASLNSFGYGGANAHVIVDAHENDAPAIAIEQTNGDHSSIINGSSHDNHPNQTVKDSGLDNQKRVFLVSHRTKAGMSRVAENLRQYTTLRSNSAGENFFDDMAYSLNSRRTVFDWRAAVTAASPLELAGALEAQMIEPKRSPQEQRLSFVFTGQGAQWYGMGRELIDRYQNFKSILIIADTHFRDLGATWSLMDELSKTAETSQVNSAAIGQPLCTAIQCALVDLLASWNVKPSSVVGHSSGEIAAAYACGSLTLRSALTISYHRGLLASTKLERNSKLRGAMLAASISETDSEAFIRRIPPGKGKAVVACVNSPGSVTLSGDRPAIMSLQSMLEARQIFVRKLAVGTAYHSHHMEVVADSYLAALQSLPKPTYTEGVTFFSSVTGDIVDSEDLDAAYWVRNMVSQVKFSPALQKLVNSVGAVSPIFHLLLELGPHGALAGFVKQTLVKIKTFQHISTLSRGKNAIDTMLNAASQLAVLGHPIDLHAVNSQYKRHPRVLVDLPPYPWDHSTSYWHESRLSIDYRKRSAPRHPLLGAPTPDFNRLEPSWRNIVRVTEIPWVRDHVIQSNIVYPAAGYIVMAVEASSQRSQLNRPDDTILGYRLRNVSIGKPLLIPDNAEGIETQLVLRPYNRSARGSSDTWNEFRIFSYSASDGWSEHCRGLVSMQYKQNSSGVEGDRETRIQSAHRAQKIHTAKEACSSTISPTRLYGTCAKLGISFQGTFRCIEAVGVGAKQSLGYIRIPDTASVMPGGIERPHVIHPSTLDACIQMTFPTLIDAGTLQVAMVPTYIKEIFIANDVPKSVGEKFLVHTETELQSARSYKSNITATSETEMLSVEVSGLVCTAIPGSASDPRSTNQGKCHRLHWEVSPDLKDNKSEELVDGAGFARGQGVPQLTLIQPANPSLLSESLTASLSSTLGERLVTISSTFEDVADAGLDGKVCICIAEIENSILKDCTASQWNALTRMLSSPSQVLWVTKGGTMDVDYADEGLITGLARTARSDNNALRLVTYDTDPKQASAEDTAQFITLILRRCFESKSDSGFDTEFTERSGQIYVPRVVEDQSLQLHLTSQTIQPQPEEQAFLQHERPLRLEVGTPGLLDSLRFVEDTTATVPLAANELRMQPKAYGVNFRDVMIALGQLEDTSRMSSEHSGVVTDVGEDLVDQYHVGDRICAWGGNAYASSVTINADAVQRIADNMSFETAASIPIVYATVYYGLVHLARLQKGESVLIHSGAGGVGQAAIMLAKHLGADVFVTVGSNEKKDLVMKTYEIPDDHIFSSRQLSFATGVKRLTDGKGVNVVLNSIAGEAFHETFECLAALGRFIEIGKRDILADARLDMGTFNKNVTFASVDLTVVFEHDPKLAKQMLGSVFALLAEDKIQPVRPLNFYSLSEMEGAFRLIQAGKHTGKVVLQANEETTVKALPSSTDFAKFAESASYILVGGLGGLGRAICRWMASRGCKNIIVLSRSGMKSMYAASLRGELERIGVKLAVYECDVSDRAHLDSVLELCSREMPPVKGIIQSAMVIRDNMIDKMTLENYQDALRPKVQGSINLHEALSTTTLDFFIMLSSCVGIIGNNGQANYASACTFQDALARYRTKLGMPTRSLDLGLIEGAGYVSENDEVFRFLTAQGFQPVKVDELLAAIEYAITQPVRDSDDCQLMIGLTGSNAETQAVNFADPKFSHIRYTRQSNATDPASEPNSLLSRLREAKSTSEVHSAVRDALVAQLSKVLVVPAEDINPSRSISDYGGDSLAAVELRNWFAKSLDVSIGVMEILSGKSIDALTSEIVTRSKLAPKVDPA